MSNVSVLMPQWQKELHIGIYGLAVRAKELGISDIDIMSAITGVIVGNFLAIGWTPDQIGNTVEELATNILSKHKEING